MKYKDVKNYTWYKITSINNREIRYIYKTDIEDGDRDIIAGFTLLDEVYNFYWMTLSREFWERYDRVKVEEGFPDDFNLLQKIEKRFIKLLFEEGIE